MAKRFLSAPSKLASIRSFFQNESKSGGGKWPEVFSLQAKFKKLSNLYSNNWEMREIISAFNPRLNPRNISGLRLFSQLT